MAFGSTPTSTVVLGTNQVPVSAVAVPGQAGGNLTALRGLNPSTDSNGNQEADVSVALQDGADTTQGLIGDSAITGDNSGTISAKLRGLNKVLGDSFGSSTAITAATTFSGVPTVSQLAANSFVTLANPGGQASFIAEFAIGSAFNGTLSFYGLNPDGTTLQLVTGHERGTSTYANLIAINVGVATNQVWTGNIAGFKALYIVCTTFTSGSVSVTLGLSSAPYTVSIPSANITTINGQTPTLDNTTVLAVSMRGKNSVAGDTAVAVDSGGNIKQASSNGAYTQVYSTTQTGVTSWAGSGDITNMHLYNTFVVNINVSAITGTNITFSVKRKDSFGNYITMASGASVTTPGTQTLDIGPGLAFARILGDIIQITAVVTSATVTFTVDVEAR